MNLKSVFFLFLISLGAFGLSFYYFPQVFPFITTSITMDAQQAEAQAHYIAKTLHWCNDEAWHTAILFDQDEMVQYYAELEAGGDKKVFQHMLKNKYYEPYVWKVRLYQEKNIAESHITFTPSGELYAAKHTISDTVLLPNVSKAEVKHKALQHMKEHVGSYEQYVLLSHATETQSNGRVDHTLTYERTDVKLHDAPYRYQISYAGNKLVAFKPFVEIPQAFFARYKHMRSYNSLIALLAWIVVIIGYLCCLGTCLFFYLYPRRFLQYKQSLMVAAFVSFVCVVLYSYNQIPLWGFAYKTHESLSLFFASKTLRVLFMGVMYAAFLFLLTVIAEATSRYVFGNHLQFFAWFKRINLHSAQAARNVLLGYSFAHFLFLAQLVFIGVATWFGAWYPTFMLTDPNVVSSYFPSLNPIAMGSLAGFFEELLCRALPIAGLFLFFPKLRNNRWTRFFIFVGQAVLFGALHAGYPMQPSYLRIIEILPEFTLIGYMYVQYGLISCIIAHIYYDVFLMAIPIFISKLWFHKCVVLAFLYGPSVYYAYVWLKHGLHHNPLYNKDWQPHLQTIKQRWNFFDTLQYSVQKRWKQVVLIVLGALSLVGFVGVYNVIKPYMLKLEVSKQEACAIARKLVRDKYSLDEKIWSMQVHYNSQVPSANIFVWRKLGAQAYHALIPQYQQYGYWQIRFVRFSGNLEERLEQYVVSVGPTKDLVRCEHLIPNEKKLSDISQETVEQKAVSIAHTQYGLKTGRDCKIVSVIPETVTGHKKWKVIFEVFVPLLDKYTKARVKLLLAFAGDKQTDAFYFIDVPDEWGQQYQYELTLQEFFSHYIGWIAFIFFLIAVCFFISWHVYAQWNVVLSKWIIVGGSCIAGFALLGELNNFQSIIATLNPVTLLFQQYVGISVRMLTTLALYVFVGINVLLLQSSYLYKKQSPLSVREWFSVGSVILFLSFSLSVLFAVHTIYNGMNWSNTFSFLSTAFPVYAVFTDAFLKASCCALFFHGVVWLVYNQSRVVTLLMYFLLGIIAACVVGFPLSYVGFGIVAGLQTCVIASSVELLYKHRPKVILISCFIAFVLFSIFQLILMS